MGEGRQSRVIVGDSRQENRHLLKRPDKNIYTRRLLMVAGSDILNNPRLRQGYMENKIMLIPLYLTITSVNYKGLYRNLSLMSNIIHI